MSNTHNDVCHSWAHKGTKCRKGFAMFHDGTTIYSWGEHFPIAKHVVDAQGQACILFTTEGYSVSTAKHKTYVRRAIPRNAIVYEVSDPTQYFKPGSGGQRSWAAKGEYDRQLKAINETLNKAKRARVYGPSLYRQAHDMMQSLNAFVDAFDVQQPHVALPEDIAATLAASEAKALEAARLEDLKQQDAIKEWQAGGNVRPPHTRTPYVRVVGDTVETSWGIKVPLQDALKAFKLATMIRQKSTLDTYTPEWPKGLRVGDWTLDHIDRNGTIRAGCHILPYEVQLEAARLAGITV